MLCKSDKPSIIIIIIMVDIYQSLLYILELVFFHRNLFVCSSLLMHSFLFSLQMHHTISLCKTMSTMYHFPLPWRDYYTFYSYQMWSILTCNLHRSMMIGLNPGPRARTVKPGPRHLRTRPNPGQNRLGPHKGITLGEARQCTPAGTEAVIYALAPTAPPPIKAAQNATTVDTRSKTVALCTRRVHLLTPSSQRDQISQGHKFAGAWTHRQTGTNSMQYANASCSWGDTCYGYIQLFGIGGGGSERT